MRYVFTSRSLRTLKKLPRDVQERLIGKLDWYCTQQSPLQFAEPLVGAAIGEYRFRVGNYRIVRDLEDGTLVVLLVGHRKDIYPEMKSAPPRTHRGESGAGWYISAPKKGRVL